MGLRTAYTSFFDFEKGMIANRVFVDFRNSLSYNRTKVKLLAQGQNLQMVGRCETHLNQFKLTEGTAYG